MPEDFNEDLDQNVEEPGQSSENAGEEDSLILGKFKSQDDLANSYKELENKLAEQGNELGSLRKLKDQQETLINIQKEQMTKGSAETQENTDDINEDSFWDNPIDVINKVLDKKLGEATEKMAISNVQTSEAVFKQSLSPADKALYDKYTDEIQGMIANLTPQDRTNPEALQWAFHNVRGSHFEDAMNLYSEYNSKDTINPDYVEKPNSKENNSENVELTPEEERNMKIYGMTKKEWIEAKKQTNNLIFKQGA